MEYLPPEYSLSSLLSCPSKARLPVAFPLSSNNHHTAYSGYTSDPPANSRKYCEGSQSPHDSGYSHPSCDNSSSSTFYNTLFYPVGYSLYATSNHLCCFLTRDQTLMLWAIFYSFWHLFYIFSLCKDNNFYSNYLQSKRIFRRLSFGRTAK